MAQLGRGHDGRVGDLHAVVLFVLFLQAAQDGNGRLHGRLTDDDLLEAPLQRSVFFNVFAVLVQRRSTHAVQLTARQGGLEHVACVHRALGLAGTDHGVQLVDKDNGLALVFGQLAEHGFQALFKLAAKLGTGQQRRHVERQYALALERIGHLARHDALRQAFDNGRLADTGLANQHRVVFGAPLQHLDGTADLVVAANHRVQLTGAGALGQVHGVFLQRLALALGIGAVHFLAAAHRVDGRFQAFAGQAVFLCNAASLALAVDQRQQKQLTGDVFVTAFDGFFFGRLQHAAQLWPALHLVLAGDVWQALDGSLCRGQQSRHFDACALQQRARAIVLLEHGHQQVHRLDVSVVVAQGQRLRVAQGFLKLGGEFVETHMNGTSELQSI